MRAAGGWLRERFERWVIDAALVGGPTAAVRAGSTFVRSIQGGYLRVYAALLVFGVIGVALYFLIVSS
jgi:hypothetical protein